MKEEEYLARIRQNAGFPRAILADITVEKRTKKVIFHLITDEIYSVADHRSATEISQDFLPAGWTAELSVSKLVADCDTVRDRIGKLLSVHSPAVAAFIRPQDIEVVQDGTVFRFCLDVTAEEKGLLRVKEILEGITHDLSRSLCGTFFGTVREVEKGGMSEITEEELADEPIEEIHVQPVRRFPIAEFAAIDGGDQPEYACCMADCNEEKEGLVICGRIVNVTERQTAKGKPFFVFLLADATGEMRVTYFSKQATVEKIRELKQDDRIVCWGNNELYNGGLSYHAVRINLGTMPEGYAVPERKKRSVPVAYHTVFPEAYEDYTQSNLFESIALPPDLTGHDFVVFDLETTGLNNTAAGGMMDSIIEIGAVKIRKGRIAEKFSTFVAYDRKLPQNIVELTGIDDGMLVGAPTVDRVIPDFYKFCDGCYLVGHNVTFDYRFVEYYAQKEDFSFTQRRYDTLPLGQELLRLPNYKLNTLAEYYGVTFRHHRAFDDALATAKIFIELIKQRGKLPSGD